MGDEFKSGIEIISIERKRQLAEEEYTADDDKIYTRGQLADAAAAYAMGTTTRRNYAGTPPGFWALSPDKWKPTPENRVKELAKAGALIAAEIDRINNYIKTETGKNGTTTKSK